MAPANFLGAANGIPSLPPKGRQHACAASHCISLEILAAIPRHRFGQVFVDHSALQDLQGLWPGTKMWPWMRDLPTGADCGWVFDENI